MITWFVFFFSFLRNHGRKHKQHNKSQNIVSFAPHSVSDSLDISSEQPLDTCIQPRRRKPRVVCPFPAFMHAWDDNHDMVLLTLILVNLVKIYTALHASRIWQFEGIFIWPINTNLNFLLFLHLGMHNFFFYKTFKALLSLTIKFEARLKSSDAKKKTIYFVTFMSIIVYIKGIYKLSPSNLQKVQSY